MSAIVDDVATLKAMLLAERARADRLSQTIEKLQRRRFGRRAETLPIDQLELGLEDMQQGEAADIAQAEAADPVAKTARAVKQRANRVALPSKSPAWRW